jgi:outer membrane lipoprotein carrier protein
MNSCRRLLPLLVAWLALAAPALGAETSTEVLDTWLARQAGLETWSADVTQVRELKALTRPLESEGRVWFRQPNRFRWQLGDPPRTIAVRTERELLVIYPQLEQAERYALDGELDPGWQQALSLLEVGFPRDREAFYRQYEPLSTTREGEVWVLALQPAAKAARRLVEQVRFEIGADDWTLLATELIFPDGSVMRNEFRNHRINPALDPALFEFEIDAGYDVSSPLESMR